MRVGSLFAGIGGFDLGFERAGFTVRWQAEHSRMVTPVFTEHLMNIERCCVWCGKPLVEKGYPNGRREGPYMFRKRWYCDVFCARRQRATTETVNPKASGRKRAQRLFPTQPCRICGRHGQRHHKDENPQNNTPTNIDWLCVSCHAREH